MKPCEKEFEHFLNTPYIMGVIGIIGIFFMIIGFIFKMANKEGKE